MKRLVNGTLAALTAAWAGSVSLRPADAGEILAQIDSTGGSIGGSIDAPVAHPPRRLPRPAQAAPRAPARRSVPMSFDGAWSVSAEGPCASAGTSQVMISGHNVIGQSGVSGHVSARGAVTTLGSFNGMTIMGRGQIVGRSASGSYRQSDGCSGSWTAIKL